MAKPTKAASKTEPVLHVVGPAKGRWRIGRHFTPIATELRVADLTEAAIEALHADPELTVVATEAAADAAVDDAAKAAADQAAIDKAAADLAAVNQAAANKA